MKTFRSKKMQELYDAERFSIDYSIACPLCSNPKIKEFNFWIIVQNSFPYDSFAKIHHMIIPKRHVKESDLTFEEIKELIEIKNTYINQNYNLIMQQVNNDQSVPNHFHLHAIVGKDNFNIEEN